MMKGVGVMKTYVTQNNVLLVVGILLIIALGIFGYYQYTKKATYIDNKEYDSEKIKTNDSIDVYYFYVTWCPHCKKARPIWEELKAEMPTVNATTIKYHEYDCEEESKGRQMANKYKVTSYPTIIMVKNNQVIEYDAKPEVSTLKQFIRTAA